MFEGKVFGEVEQRTVDECCHLVLLFVTSSQLDCNVSVYCCHILLLFVTTRNSSDVLNDEARLLCVRIYTSVILATQKYSRLLRCDALSVVTHLPTFLGSQFLRLSRLTAVKT